VIISKKSNTVITLEIILNTVFFYFILNTGLKCTTKITYTSTTERQIFSISNFIADMHVEI